MENNLIKSTSGSILLFDMDGTLTPARKKVDSKTRKMIRDLCDRGHKVCIVSGSPFDYIQEQMMLSTGWLLDEVVLMPCNGTQVYTQKDTQRKYEQTYEVTMRGYLEAHSSLTDPYKELVRNILELQTYALRRYDFPVTGNFISDRGSMINWSPVGRDASHEDRASFVLEDIKNNLRKHLCDCLRVRLDDADLRTTDLALGGSTSIDIFPKGWDKTHALRHIDPSMKVWFWGDKCDPRGNDHTLWKALQSKKTSFAVEDPADTRKIVQGLIDNGVL